MIITNHLCLHRSLPDAGGLVLPQQSGLHAIDSCNGKVLQTQLLESTPPNILYFISKEMLGKVIGQD